MSDRNEQEQLFDLLARVELAWMERGDHTLVDRLATQYPELAEPLYLFFATMVGAPDELDRSRPELGHQSKRIRDWLHEGGGFAAAAAAAGQSVVTGTPSTVTGEGMTPAASPLPTFFGILKDALGAPDPEAMARRLEISVDFLREVSKHADLLPTKVRRELARRAEQQLFVDATLALATLDERQMHAAPPLARAASRVRGMAFERRSLTFEDLVRRSSMDESRQRYWLSLAES